MSVKINLKDMVAVQKAEPDNDIIFSDDLFAPENESVIALHKWKVLIVDDEPEVHSVTKMALADFKFQQSELEIISLFNAADAMQFLTKHNDIALLLLDVVMETDDAGLKVVKYVRETLKNTNIRIVLRTGQPGIAPEAFVIENYDIDDYKAKTELTVQKLYTTVIASLRAYSEIIRIEKIVAERTLEITAKNAQLERQNALIVQKNNDLLDSIYYARRIQEAMLPQKELMRHFLKDSFVFFKPKAIVSGDFFWFHPNRETVLVSAVDCTGHGVPGALMSVMGMNFLNQIVSEKPDIEPIEILTELDHRVRRTLQQDKETITAQDGMDIAICKINIDTLQIHYAAAMRPLYLFKNDQFTEIKGSRTSIGGSDISPFQQTTLQGEIGDTLYMFSDGFTDQFGGEQFKRKYTTRKFQQFLNSIQKHHLPAQEQSLLNEFNKWKKTYEQTDDVVVVVGVRL